MKRECGDCTKCCEGWLEGEALGHTFHAGKPCHFISIGKGCTVYAKRPQNPCISYKCGWLNNLDLPEWLKPSEINAIIDMQIVEGISYLRLVEAGEILDSKVLSWILKYAIANQLNFLWFVEGGVNWIGTDEFDKVIKLQHNKKVNTV
jgi:hypothetical protein